MSEWVCPCSWHRPHMGPDGKRVETVRVVGGVAYCTEPGCGRFGALVKRGEA